MLTMHQNTFCSRAPPGPELKHSPILLAAMREATFTGEGEGKEREGKGKRRCVVPVKIALPVHH